MPMSAPARQGPIQEFRVTASVYHDLQVAVDTAATEACNFLGSYGSSEPFPVPGLPAGLAAKPLADSGFLAARAFGVRLIMPRSYYVSLIEAGALTDGDIADAIEELSAAGVVSTSTARVRAEARQTEAPAERFRLPTIATLAANCGGIDWPTVIQGSIANWAADYLEKGVAVWSVASGEDEPWPSYQQVAGIDRTAELLGLRDARTQFSALPAQPTALLNVLAQELEMPQTALAAYFHRLLADVAAWVGPACGRGWQRDLRGEDASAARQLLAVRAAWELVLYRALGDSALHGAIDDFRQRLSGDDSELWRTLCSTDLVLHRAFERAGQRKLATALAAAETAAPGRSSGRPEAQVAFCMDAGAERLRRALESTLASVQTLGFAGFPDMPKALQSDADQDRSACPELLLPGLQAALFCHDSGAVEFPAVRHLGKLVMAILGGGWGASADRVPRRYTLTAGLTDRISLARSILHSMSLTQNFAPLVLLTGHDSGSTGDTAASVQGCGACGGGVDGVHARLAAELLNDRFIRAGLLQHGIDIPADTQFCAALHDADKDRVTLLESASGCGQEGALQRKLQTALDAASAIARAERESPASECLAGLPDKPGLRYARAGTETRGAMDGAGGFFFIAGPRERTRRIDFGGSSFLHDYCYRKDENDTMLENLMTGPLLAASRITQQHAYGAQAWSRGSSVASAALRLTAAVEAPPHAIDRIIDMHCKLEVLVENGWIQMHAIDSAGALWRRQGEGDWSQVMTNSIRAAASEAA